MPYPFLLHSEPLPLWQSMADPYLCRRCSNTVLSQSLWGLWVLMCTRFVWALWESLAVVGFDSKCKFAPATIFLGLLLLPLDVGYLLTTAPAPTIFRGFSDLECGISPHAAPVPHSHHTQTMLNSPTFTVYGSQKKKEKICQKILEEIIAENFLNMGKETVSQVQKT